MQMYIYDSEHEVANCSVSQPGIHLDSELIKALQEELHEYNAHVQIFRAFNIANQDPRAKIVLMSGDTGLINTSLLCAHACQQADNTNLACDVICESNMHSMHEITLE